MWVPSIELVGNVVGAPVTAAAAVDLVATGAGATAAVAAAIELVGKVVGAPAAVAAAVDLAATGAGAPAGSAWRLRLRHFVIHSLALV